MKKLLSLSTGILLSLSLNAQSTIIEYDFQTESYTYFKVKKKGDTIKIKKPFGYRDIPTKLVIKNFNSFYYNVNFDVNYRQDTPVGGDQNMTALSENFTQGAQAFNQLIGEVKENDIYQSLWVDGEFQGLGGLMNAFGMAESYEKEVNQVAAKAEKLQIVQEKISVTTEQLQQTFEALLLADFVNEQMEKLKRNKLISPDEMKARSEELAKKVFTSEPSLERVIKLSEGYSGQLRKEYNTFSSEFGTYEILYKDLNSFFGNLEESLGEEIYSELFTELEYEVVSKHNQTAQIMDGLDMLMQEYSHENLRQKYLSVFESYDEIQHANFDLEYSINNDNDITLVTMEFRENTFGDTSKIGEAKRTRLVEIPTHGGLRINSSAGMSFMTYFNGNNNYTSTNGIVNEVRGDAFTPSLSTMFHFYNQTPRAVSLGGAFGVGVPIEGDKDFIYMLGGSLIFGKTQRVIFNFGGFGGKVNRLSGMSVGDAIPEGTIVPTQKVFDFGAYAGVTLNINSFF